jgi:hypothetical protein
MRELQQEVKPAPSITEAMTIGELGRRYLNPLLGLHFGQSVPACARPAWFRYPASFPQFAAFCRSNGCTTAHVLSQIALTSI